MIYQDVNIFQLTEEVIAHTPQLHAPLELWMTEYLPAHTLAADRAFVNADHLRLWINTNDTLAKAGCKLGSGSLWDGVGSEGDVR
jgi:hypothetical protein